MKQNNTTTIVETIHELSLRVSRSLSKSLEAIRELPLRIVRNGMLFALGFFGTTILAVAISGTIKTWTTGEVLKSADLNTTIASLQTAIQNIPNWTKAANGTDAYFMDGNVGIGTSSPQTKLEVNGVFSFRDASGKVRNAGITSAAGASVIKFGINDGPNNEFGGSYTQADQGGFLQFDVRSCCSLVSLWGRTAGSASNPTQILNIQSNGYVGIGTTSPTQTLHLHNGIQPVLKLTSTSGDFQMGVNNTDTWVASVGSNPLEISVGGSERMRITSTGLVGIGRTPTTHPLEVQGTAGLTSGTAWTNISDERLKDIDGTISSALDNLLKLNPIKYKYNEASGKLFKNADGKSKYGFTAQNVKSVFPEMVITDDKGYLWYNPSGFEAILTSAIKEVAFRLRSTSDSVSVVTQKIDSLEKEKAANEKKLLALEESNQKLIEDNKRLREMVETHGRASLRLEDRLRAIENTQMARK